MKTESASNMTQLTQTTEEIKSCCANLYESDWATLLLGDSFHPGGLALTERLGRLLELEPGQRVLDVAAGRGTSAIFLAQKFGCNVIGIDYGTANIAEATANAAAADVEHLVHFEQGDAEQLLFDDNSFDAVICECAFCTFPNKSTAAQEFARVLRPGGRVGLSDLTRNGPLPPELDTLLAWIACIADARPIDEYKTHLQNAGFEINRVEPHLEALAEMVRNVQTKLLGAEIMVKLNKLNLPGDINLEQAKALARHTSQAIQADQLGYTLITGIRPASSTR